MNRFSKTVNKFKNIQLIKIKYATVKRFEIFCLFIRMILLKKLLIITLNQFKSGLIIA